MRGTLLTNSSKYSLLINLAVTSLPNKSALFNDYYTLIIQNFATSDFGYYWCQIVVNDTCLLLPSPYGHIAENTTARACSASVLRQGVYPPICAGSDSSIDKFTSSPSSPTTVASTPFTSTTQNRPVASTQFTSTTQNRPVSSTPFTSTTQNRPVASTQFTSTTQNRSVSSTYTIIIPSNTGSPSSSVTVPIATNMSWCDVNKPQCYGAIGGSIAVFLILSLIVMCVGLCICLRRRKRRKMLQKNGTAQTIVCLIIHYLS